MSQTPDAIQLLLEYIVFPTYGSKTVKAQVERIVKMFKEQEYMLMESEEVFEYLVFMNFSLVVLKK